MREQRTSQESAASRWESFELGPVLCPDAQMTFFFFRSEKKKKKNCCWKNLNITLWQETKDQTYFLREIVTMEKENTPLKIFRRKICSVVQRKEYGMHQRITGFWCFSLSLFFFVKYLITIS